MDPRYTYIRDHKGYPIHQDMDNGYFSVHSEDGIQISYEATIQMVEDDIELWIKLQEDGQRP